MANHVNGPLNWERLGKHGPPMVLIHPGPTDLSAWLYQMAHFSTWFRTIGVDLPGFGRSPTAEAGVSLADVAEACWEAVDETSAEPAVVVGLSIGSSVAQFMGALRPERTLALVLTGGYVSSTDEAFRAHVSRNIEPFRSVGISSRRRKVLDGFSPAFAESPLGIYFADVMAERNDVIDLETITRLYDLVRLGIPDWVHAGIKAPTLIISGSADVGHRVHRVLQTRIAGAELSVIEGAGHMCNYEQPWEYDRYLLAFLRRHGLVGSG